MYNTLMLRKTVTVGIGFIFLFQTSCATIFSGTSQSLTITTDVPGTRIYVDGLFVGSRQAFVRVSKKDNPVIVVKKSGCDDGVMAVDKEFDPLTLLGLLIDLGIVSIFFVDFIATGAVQKFKQTNFIVNPICGN